MAIQRDADKVAADILREPEKTPEIMRRCIVSVMQQPQVRGRSLYEKFVGAVAISLNSLRSAKPPRMHKAQSRPRPMALTGFGFQQQNRKRVDGSQHKKLREFDRLIAAVRAEQKQGQQRATVPGSRQ